MSNLYINVKVYGGVSIEHVCEDACRLATQWGITVHFAFNGVECMAIPGGSALVLKENWEKVVDSKSRYPMASTNPSASDAAPLHAAVMAARPHDPQFANETGGYTGGFDPLPYDRVRNEPL